MKFNNILTLLIFNTIILISCFSTKNKSTKNPIQTENIFSKKEPLEYPEKVSYKNKIFNDNIKTVLCLKNNQDISVAIINLESNEKIILSFDDLDADVKDYYYTIIHCNADWTASNLIETEYIDGFTEEAINDYEFSFNTIQKYTHYQFEFPSQNIKPRISGNYIFKIYEKNSDTIIYKRFMVLDNKIHINADVKRATLAKDRKIKHEVDFILKHPNLVVMDPFSDIKVHIKQNNKDDNAIKNLLPQFVRNGELIYDYDEENTFPGNNEFRHFEFKSLRYKSDRIKTIEYDSIYNNIYLFDDKKRSYESYSIIPDINGNFIIKSQEGWKSSVEADYAFVHFSLPIDKISYGNLFLLGNFSDWQLKEEFKLKYNQNQKKYEGKIYLKQGYYNYHYALEDTISKNIDISFIEGTHYQTANDYYLYVYYRSVGDRYDRLLGFLKTSSKELY